MATASAIAIFLWGRALSARSTEAQDALRHKMPARPRHAQRLVPVEFERLRSVRIIDIEIYWTTLAKASSVAKHLIHGDNRDVQNDVQSPRRRPSVGNPFAPGAMVILTLGNPREKFWGAILAVTAEGLSLAGIELASFDDRIAMIKEGEPFAPGVVFFPMHRVERMELDLPDADLPSLAQRFAAKTGIDPASVFASAASDAQERP